MDKKAYEQGVRQALFDAGVSASDVEKTASDLGASQALTDTVFGKTAGLFDIVKARRMAKALSVPGRGAYAHPGGLENVLELLEKTVPGKVKDVGSKAFGALGRGAGAAQRAAVTNPALSGALGGAGVGGGLGALLGEDMGDVLTGAGVGAGLGAGGAYGAKKLLASPQAGGSEAALVRQLRRALGMTSPREAYRGMVE